MLHRWVNFGGKLNFASFVEQLCFITLLGISDCFMLCLLPFSEYVITFENIDVVIAGNFFLSASLYDVNMA